MKRLLFVSVLLLLLAPASDAQQVKQEFLPPEVIEAERQKQIIPVDVWNLFYAVKNSLDYGVVPKGQTIPGPLKKLTDYRRVTPALLNRADQSFSVGSYSVSGGDYELVVVNRTNPAIRFKATRSAMFVWRSDHWEMVGKYVYL